MESAADDDKTLESVSCLPLPILALCLDIYMINISLVRANVIPMTPIYQRVPLINVGCQPHAAHSRPPTRSQPRGDGRGGIRKTFLSARDPLSSLQSPLSWWWRRDAADKFHISRWSEPRARVQNRHPAPAWYFPLALFHTSTSSHTQSLSKQLVWVTICHISLHA